jgi:hypothetical protein
MKEMIKKMALKVLSGVAIIQYPKMDKAIRYYIRDNYYSRLNQLRFVSDDYIFKKKYKVIDYYGEFSDELNYVLPFAYWHHLNGTLKKTISCKGTKDLYFFSDNHEEKYQTRDPMFSYDNYDTPNKTNSISKDYSKWARVPLKEHYKNDVFVFDKPIFIIANKYNIEWDGPPLNYFDVETLDKIISTYKNKYQIIYNRPLATRIVEDNSDILDLGEQEWLRTAHPEVIILDDLFRENANKVNSFNHFQLMVYANSEKFISIHGGTATLASYFGGVNIILSKGKKNPSEGGGLETMFGEFATIFSAVSGAKILHAKNEADIFNFLSLYY